MAKYTLGHRSERWRWNFYFFGILLLLGLGSCVVCTRVIDWKSLQRGQLAKRLLAYEDKVLVDGTVARNRTQKLWAECNRWLHGRWMVGYFVENNETGKFCGRNAPDFWRAVGEQKEDIIAGREFDIKKIPRYRFTVEFKKLHCRLIAADATMADMQDAQQQR